MLGTDRGRLLKPSSPAVTLPQLSSMGSMSVVTAQRAVPSWTEGTCLQGKDSLEIHPGAKEKKQDIMFLNIPHMQGFCSSVSQ